MKWETILQVGKTIFDLKLFVTYYARVSSEKEEQINSLENQINIFEDYIKKNPNWTFVPGYVDEDRKIPKIWLNRYEGSI